MATTADIGVPGQPMNNPPLTPWQAAVRDAVPPVGAVVMFGGTVAPPGWHLCDGTAHGSSALQAVIGSANTPDLRARFVVGAGPAYTVGATGGADTVTLTTPQMPAHVHSPAVLVDGSVALKWGNQATPGTGRAGVFSEAVAANTIATASTGGGGAHENRPPYYALTFIIRKQP